MKKINLKLILIILSFVILLIIGLFSYIFIFKKGVNIKNDNLDDQIILDTLNYSDISADITDYYIYGNHFNITGNLKLENDISSKDSKISLVMLDKNSNNQKELDFIYEIKSNIINFKTSNYINEGIYLDEIKQGNFKILVKITDLVTGLSTYYNLSNKSKYSNLDYYTITRNNSNNYIEIYFEDSSLNISCKNCSLPDNVYDIVIDQGHGGASTGAMCNGYIESEINYNYGVLLKTELEKLGLKVLITRNNNIETVGNYNENGRAVIPNKVRAKYCFSIHNNYSIYENNSGVEIYCPNFANLDLGKSLADNIVKMANSSYSPNTVGLVTNGVYVLTFDQDTIDECYEEALEENYEPYKMTTDTTLFFMIREVGGRLTGGYIDGRDKKVGKNPYFNSNNVAEAYLLELGYLSNIDDINNVVNNMSSYVKAIKESIKEELNL